MFAKLLKYEWQASRGILGMLSLAALGAGILGAVVLRILVTSAMSYENEVSDLLPALLSMVMFFLVLALVAYAVGSQIFLLYRFYKNKFTDEGYLTFTLPVTARQIFLSSFLNMAIWMTIISLVIGISVLVMFVAGIQSAGYFDEAFFQDMEHFYGSPDVNWVDGILMLLSGLISFVYSLVAAMTCITIGAVIAKKHKILAAFGIYYGLSMVSGVAETVLTFLIALMNPSNITILQLGSMGVQLLLTVVGFFLSTYLMKHKLNLP